MAARFLGMDAQTWDRQPYWAQRIYAEGLHLERPWQVRLNINPETWWSPLDPAWDEFGVLNIPDESSNHHTVDDETIEEAPRVRLEGLPTAESLGAPVTKVTLPRTSS